MLSSDFNGSALEAKDGAKNGRTIPDGMKKCPVTGNNIPMTEQEFKILALRKKLEALKQDTILLEK